MNEKIRMLEMAADKASTDSGFIAFIIKKYLEFENIPEHELPKTLGCSEEDYYKLMLCKMPEISASDFVARLTNICQYTNTSVIELNKIIKRTTSLINLSGVPAEQTSYLMAARDKHDKDQNPKK